MTYSPFQGTKGYPPRKGALVKEVLLYSYGQKPQPSESGPGDDFYDEYGTRGKGPFGETQQFFVRLPGSRNYRVQIEPCTASNTFGAPVWQNIVKAAAQTVLINDDAGSTEGRVCKQK